MARISSFSPISQPGLLGRLGYSVSSLLGSNQPEQQTDETQTGLLGVPNRRQAAFSALGSLMQGAGVGLATGDWGRAIETSNAAMEQEQQRRILDYRMKQDAEDRQWRNEQRAHERKGWASEEDQQNQLNSLLGNITDPQKRLWAEMDPEGYLRSEFSPREAKRYNVGGSLVDENGRVIFQDNESTSWRPATAEEKQSLGLKPDVPLIFTAKGEPKILSGGGTSVNVNSGGGSDNKIFDETKARAEAARAAYSGLTALNEAATALPGSITGAAANERLGLQKIASLFGVGDTASIVNTETFRAAIAPQVAAMLKATVGSTQISNADREFAEKAAGGSITLDGGSIGRLINIMRAANTATVRKFNEDLNTIYPEGAGFDRERALFGVPSVPGFSSQPFGPPLPPGASPQTGAPEKWILDADGNPVRAN